MAGDCPVDARSQWLIGGGFTLTRGVEAIISIWSFIVFLHCLGQVHRFSAWRALGAVLLPGAALLAIAVVVKAALT